MTDKLSQDVTFSIVVRTLATCMSHNREKTQQNEQSRDRLGEIRCGERFIDAFSSATLYLDELYVNFK